MRRAGLRRIGLTLALPALVLLTAAPAGAVTWIRVATGSAGGVSGLTAAGSGWLVVHDAKVAGRTRVSLLSAAGVLTPLTWPGTPPDDLEAVDSVPGAPATYAAVTSGGAGRLFTVDGTTLRVTGTFALPTGRQENEGFALTGSPGAVLAVWGNRGSGATPGRLFAATFDPTARTFGAVVSGPVSVPYPTGAVRHISDVEVRAGRVYVASASDGGERGPFASAVYDVGTVALVAGRARLTLGAPVSLGRYPDHKIEGLACSAGDGRAGTDDEALGGYVAAGSFCDGAAVAAQAVGEVAAAR